MEDGMTTRAILTFAMGVALAVSAGCQTVRTMGDDFSRALSSQPTSQNRSYAAARPAQAPLSRQPAGSAAKSTSGDSSTTSTSPESSAASDTTANLPAPSPAPGPAVQLAGKSENELRALLGSPTNEEDRPPGKRWRYRDGQCILDVQLYPDVRTKQFGTLAYEVKSDDNTDEGRRLCLAQLQSRLQARR
jgi:hypothetical protein